MSPASYRAAPPRVGLGSLTSPMRLTQIVGEDRGFDRLNRRAGLDRLNRRAGFDRLNRRAGHDRLNQRAGLDRLNQRAGLDRLNQRARLDRLNQRARLDRLNQRARLDRLNQRAGFDRLNQRAGFDRLNQRAGFDRLNRRVGWFRHAPFGRCSTSGLGLGAAEPMLRYFFDWARAWSTRRWASLTSAAYFCRLPALRAASASLNFWAACWSN